MQRETGDQRVIKGGEDLTLGEVNQISEIIHDAAGDQAEIIFGAVHDAAMQGEVRVTVIATGFDKVAAQQESPYSRPGVPGVLPFPQRAPRPAMPPAPSASPPGHTAMPEAEVGEMEIPTFIRRQMD